MAVHDLINSILAYCNFLLLFQICCCCTSGYRKCKLMLIKKVNYIRYTYDIQRLVYRCHPRFYNIRVCRHISVDLGMNCHIQPRYLHIFQGNNLKELDSILHLVLCSWQGLMGRKERVLEWEIRSVRIYFLSYCYRILSNELGKHARCNMVLKSISFTHYVNMFCALWRNVIWHVWNEINIMSLGI